MPGQLIALVMLIIYFESHLCEKQLVYYDYNQFCPLFDLTRNMTKFNLKRTSLKTHIFNSGCCHLSY
jgi:hypothetical protein